MDTQSAAGALYPILPLRDIVVFPHMVVPLFVGREKSVRALDEVMNNEKQIPNTHDREWSLPERPRCATRFCTARLD